VTRIVCLGDAMADVVARLPGPLMLGSDTPAPIAVLGGGSAANTAAWVAAAGCGAAFVGRVGDDVLGRQLRDDLIEIGIELTLSVDPALPTGTCIVLVDEAGERTMIPSTGANAALAPADLPGPLFRGGDHLHVSGYALFGGARSAALAALTLARESGLSISVGAASSAPLRAVGGEQFLRWIGRDVLLFANRDEARVLTDDEDATRAASALAARVGRAIVTDGADGAAWSDGTSPVTVPAPAVDIVDSTGAGDAFAAAVLVALSNGSSPAEALRRGHALAARACGVVGGRPLSGGR
jgi:ribokinase